MRQEPLRSCKIFFDQSLNLNYNSWCSIMVAISFYSAKLCGKWRACESSWHKVCLATKLWNFLKNSYLTNQPYQPRWIGRNFDFSTFNISKTHREKYTRVQKNNGKGHFCHAPEKKVTYVSKNTVLSCRI